MRELSTDVQLHDGELIVFGGLDQNNNIVYSSYFSWFPKWFGSNSSSVTRSQIVLVLHVQRI